MLKKLTFALLFSALTFGAFAQSDLKFAHINTQEVFNIMPETSKAEKDLEELTTTYKKELTNMENEFQAKYAEFVAAADSLPQGIKARRMSEIEELQQRASNFQQFAMQEIEKKQAELLAPIMEKIKKAIDQVGNEQGFIYIFDITSPSQPILYHSNKSVDAAPLVKAKLGLK